MKFLPLLLIPTLVFGGLSETPVQTAVVGGVGAAASASFTLTLGSTPTTGNWILVGVGAAQAGILQLKCTATNIYFQEVANPAINTTAAHGSHIFWGYVGASPGTVITVSSVTTGVQTMCGVAAEFAGVGITQDAVSVTATGNTASPAVTLNAGDRANAMLVAVLTTRGQWSGQTAVFSSFTNSFVKIGEQNTILNSGATNDKAMILLIHVVAASGSTSAGATITSNQWSATGANFAETQRGFFTQ